jgi:hypothetical protein
VKQTSKLLARSAHLHLPQAVDGSFSLGSAMAIDTSGTWWRGDTFDDLVEYLRALTADSYPALVSDLRIAATAKSGGSLLVTDVTRVACSEASSTGRSITRPQATFDASPRHGAP